MIKIPPSTQAKKPQQTVLKHLTSVKKPPTAIIPPQPKPSPAPVPLPKLPPLHPMASPVTNPQVFPKPVTLRTNEPSKPSETKLPVGQNITNTTVRTDSAHILAKPVTSTDVVSSISTSTSVAKEKLSHTTKEKMTVSEHKSTPKDKTGFALPSPKPSTKPG